MNTLLLAGAVFAVILALIGLWAVTLRRVVPTNMVHIVQSRSATISYGKGKAVGNVYYHWPAFLPYIGVTVSQFPESVFDINLNSYEAYDSGRLPFVVDIVAFFRVDDSDMAAHRVSSFDELSAQLHSVLQGAVRRILATDKLENIMEDRSGLGVKFTEEVDRQLKEWGVTTVKSIEFMDIRDSAGSKVIANIMAKEQSRIDKESRMTVADNNMAASNREIDAKRAIDVQRQDAEQQVGIRTAEKTKIVGIENERANQNILIEKTTTKQKEMDVSRVENVQSAEILRAVAEVRAGQEVQVLVIQAGGNKTAQITKAEGEMEAAKLNAQAIEVEGLAKGVAEQAVLMAPVNTQINLAKEIGSNEGYQKYLITIRQVEVAGEVGKQMAEGLKGSDVKIIANTGTDIQSGVSKVMDLFTPAGGTSIAGMLTALAQTDEGQALANKFLGGKEAK